MNRYAFSVRPLKTKKWGATASKYLALSSSRCGSSRRGRARKSQTSITRETERHATLVDLPAELIELVLSNLPGRDLAAAALACRALQHVSDCERLWEAAYRRDIDPHGPPIEHHDHRVYGKSVRWLYGLMRMPVGVLRVGPTGRTTGRLVWPGGIKSGEFVVGPPTNSSSHTLLLDGYGADVTYDVKESKLYEGIYERGVCIGIVRYATFSHQDTAESQSTGVTFTRRGPVVDGHYHGICKSQWASGERGFYQFVRGAMTGWSLTMGTDGYARSGQTTGNAWNVGRGVERMADGTLIEYAPCAGRRWDMTILVRRTPHGPTERMFPPKDRSKDDSVHLVDYSLDPRVAVSNDATGVTRVHMDGYVIIADDQRILFVAVDDSHKDHKAAGRRWIADTSRTTEHWKDSMDVFTALSRLVPSARDARFLNDALVGLMHATYEDLLTILDGAGLDAIAHQRETVATRYGDDNEIRDGHKGRDARPAIKGSGGAMPYGVALAVDDPPGAEPYVRCFLTGDMVPARDCTLHSTGRLYDASLLAQWVKFSQHDPETGSPVIVPTGGLLWADWMRAVPASILAWAVTEAYNNTSASALANVKVDMGTRYDLVRNAAANCMGVPLRPGIDVMRAAARAATNNNDDDNDDANTVENGAARADDASGLAALTPGLERIALAHVELRHPGWDPRGPWQSGPPPEALDDPTMGDHERDPNGPPDAFLNSHGILKVAIAPGASFVGARLTGVFFFGQRFEAVSFVGATLDRCAFMGCTFDDGCAFDRALVSGSRLYCCTDATGREMTIDALAKRSAFVIQEKKI